MRPRNLPRRSQPTRSHSTPEVLVRHGRPTPSEVYPVIWQFAARRQQIYERRIAGLSRPWTDDQVLAQFKFTNVYRASDRVSQYLIRLIYEDTTADVPTLFLRIILFKLFNKIETWEAITAEHGKLTAETFDVNALDRTLSEMMRRKKRVYSGAYIMPSGGKSGGPKHSMHLGLLKSMLDDGLPKQLSASKSLEEAYELLLAYRSIGKFLAFQYAIDLNYSPLMDHSEMDFVVAGPGALDGLSKCFLSLGEYSPEDTIRLLVDIQEDEFSRAGLDFAGLWGRPLQLIDLQNVFCEVSKYTRATHPHVQGVADRKRIKQKFAATGPLPSPFFPPKWGLDKPTLHPGTKSQARPLAALPTGQVTSRERRNSADALSGQAKQLRLC